ncbi:hypothetical protein CGZ80_22835 [Rhodopirellula sp. MGV]|nr:hypothetical protein CGZ80_22835 [Rhodopirellula sp. MGV]PNY34682.1 PEP-CTERM sorting domain-containing protein [Rhodopirellula baltica]
MTGNQIEIGDTVTVNVTLDDIDPGWRVFWSTGVELSDNLTSPSNVTFDTGSQLSQAFTVGGGPFGGELSTMMMSTPFQTSSSFSFTTTAAAVGQTTIQANGFALGLGLGRNGSGGIQLLPISAELLIDVVASSAADAPAIASAPEPATFAIFGALVMGSGLRRRSRSSR